MDPVHPERSAFSPVAGSGEMDQRIAAFDWAATSLGPIAGWPPSLRSALSICLESNFPLALYWGRDFVLLYNDASSGLAGERHPWVLGRPAREAWADLWGIISPDFEQAFAGEQAVRQQDQLLPISRHGYTEECYFDYTLSAVRGEGGQVEGLFSTIVETTWRVIGERRLRTLRDLAVTPAGQVPSVEHACESAASVLAENSHDLPFILLYLLDADKRQVSLAGSAGVGRDTPISPVTVDLNERDVPWPFAEVLQTQRSVEVHDLSERFGPLVMGPWPEPIKQAVVLPVARPGQAQLAGFVVAGVSPRRLFDDAYRGFFDLVAAQIATSVAHARAYEEERHRAEALAELDRAKTNFFSNISHEFRTPLTLMLSPVEDLLAKPEGEVRSENRELLTVVNRNGLRLLRLVNTLLDFSRIEAGRVTAVYQPTALAAFTRDLCSIFLAVCERGGLRLVIDCPTLAEPVYVDREMWEKVVLNLLANAFKFTFEGEIAVTLRQVDHVVQLRVADTGTGIPSDELPRLFERFHRIENAHGRTHEGSGIGLALVQELVKLHGGFLNAESVFGQGSTFTVTLPLGSAHLPAERIRESLTAASTGAGVESFVEESLRWLPDEAGVGDGVESILPHIGAAISGERVSVVQQQDRPRVLIADDNTDLRQYLVRLLCGQYELCAVNDGEQALAAARQWKPDLVLADVMMPRLDGFGLLRELRADPTTGNLPIIMLSARAGEESRLEGLEAGADDYLVKPFSARELLARVGATLQMARMRRQASETLQKSHARFEALVNSAPLGICLVDANMRIRQVNPKARPVFGDLQGLIGDDFSKIIHDVWSRQSADEVVEIFRRTLRTGEPCFIPEHIEQRLDGHATEYYEWQIHRLSLPDGQYGVVCYFSDVSRHVLARQALAENERRLRAEVTARNRLHELVGRLQICSDLRAALEEVLEATLILMGAQMGSVQLFNPQSSLLEIVAHRGLSDEFLKHYRATGGEGTPWGRAYVLGQRVIVEDLQSDGRFEIHRAVTLSAGIVAVQATPLLGHRGEVLGMLSTHYRHPHRPGGRDLRILDLYARQAADYIERILGEEALKQADRRKDEFLATLAHELRNPLAPIRTGLELIRMAGEDRAMVDDIRTKMEGQTRQLVRLVDDLLDVSRISSGKVMLRKECVNLASVVQSAVEATRWLVVASGHELTVNLPSQPVYLDGDMTRLAQVLSNLLANAVRYTEDAGHILLDAEQQEGEVVVTVSDNGIGIPADMLDNIFEMFTQVDQSLERSRNGLGIGLTLVKRLVEMHGGSVQARSEGPGKGSQFSIRLPTMTEPLRQIHAPHAQPMPPPAGGLRILIVDDNKDAAGMLGAVVKMFGNEVRMAYDGLEALEVAAEFHPDVVLMDLGMPKLNGYDTARRMREQWDYPMKIVALTGWGQDEDRRRTQDAGFDHHLVKPVEPSDLQDLLASCQPRPT